MPPKLFTPSPPVFYRNHPAMASMPAFPIPTPCLLLPLLSFLPNLDATGHSMLTFSPSSGGRRRSLSLLDLTTNAPCLGFGGDTNPFPLSPPLYHVDDASLPPNPSFTYSPPLSTSMARAPEAILSLPLAMAAKPAFPNTTPSLLHRALRNKCVRITVSCYFASLPDSHLHLNLNSSF